MLNDKEIRQLMKSIFRSVEIKYPEFAFKMLKEALRQAHQEGIEQGKLEGIAEEKKRSIQVVDVNQEVEEIQKQARQEAEIKERERITELLAKLIAEIENKAREEAPIIRKYVFPLLNNLHRDLIKIIWKNELEELRSQNE